MAERRRLWRGCGDLAQAAGAALLFGLFRMLPLDWASATGGFLARTIGPRLGISARARRNLHRAMPELGPPEIERIVSGMWDNLGRVIAEYPHLAAFRIYEKGGRVELVGVDDILAQRATGKRYIFFSAHYGNWEIAALVARQAGFEVATIYRAANNPLVDRLIGWARGEGAGELIPKGSVAARRAIAALNEGRHLCMLVDQKMNDGIAVPFFGRDAMTAPALARLALRFDCTVVPARVLRLGGAHFRLEAEPPLEVAKSGDLRADTLALMTQVNATIERWCRDRPDHWFWLHRRWPE